MDFDLDLIKEISPSSDKNFFHKSDMDHTYKKGRPFGGLLWVINSQFKVLEYSFINRHLTFIHLKFYDFEFVCIGVYMPFDNSKKRDHSKSTFEITLSLILSLKNQFKNLPVFLMGDFNSDIKRNNRFDILLKDFISKNSLIFLDNLDQISNKPTYNSALINNTITSANIDHFILNSNKFLSLFNTLKFSVLEDICNLSDHNPITLDFSISIDPSNSADTLPEKPKTPKLNLDNHQVLSFYNDKVDSYFNKLLLDLSSSLYSNLDEQTYIDKFYSDLTGIYSLASSQALELQESLNPSASTRNREPLFHREMKRIKRSMAEEYKIMKIYNKKHSWKYIKLKKELRQVQRKSKFFEEMKSLSKLEKLAKDKNKKKFLLFFSTFL